MCEFLYVNIKSKIVVLNLAARFVQVIPSKYLQQFNFTETSQDNNR